MKSNYLIIPLVTLITAIWGNTLTSGGMAWYKTIIIPSWTPPGMVIGIVWTIIFILATISALIVYNRAINNNYLLPIMALFLINAGLNIFWSYLFFTAHLLGPAIWEAGLLGLSVLILILVIWPVSTTAALLLLPYLGWVSFATFLTYSVWLLNK